MPPRVMKAGTIVYHGTSCEPGGEMFVEFDPGYGDWDVVWVTLDQSIAAMYAMRSICACPDNIPAVLEVEITEDMKVIDVDRQKGKLEIDVDDLSDPREIYRYIDRDEYGVAKAKGQIDDVVYDDYAVLAYENMKIKRFKTFVDGKWSGWKDIDDGNACAE